MSDLDDRIRRGLEGLAAPAEPGDVFDGIERRKRRRSVMRRVQRGALVVAVLAGSAGGALALNRAFQGSQDRLGQEPRGDALIAFRRDNRIFIVRADGSGAFQVVPEPPKVFGVGEDEPAWSPDGRSIAYNQSDAGMMIVSLDDGVGMARLVTHGRDTSPDWSPDGRWLVFSRTPAEVEGGGPLQLRRVAAETFGSRTAANNTRTEPLVTGPGNSSQPAWSPDGRTIAFVNDRAGDPDIYLLDLSTGSVRLLVRNEGVEDLAPAWSPDGQMIAYASDGDIWLTDVDGITQTNLTPNATRSDSSPAWSPDGERIAFSGGIGDRHPDIYVMEADPDAIAQRLTTSPDSEFEPDWQPVSTPVPIPGPTVSPSPSPSGTGCSMLYRRTEPVLDGDIDGNGDPDRVEIWRVRGPVERCPAQVTVIIDPFFTGVPDDPYTGQLHARIEAPSWLFPDPKLLLLAQIDGRAGLEIMVDLSPSAVYRTAAIFTLDGDSRSEWELVRMQLPLPWSESPSSLFPFADEMPLGIDCVDGGIVLTTPDYNIGQQDRGLDPLPFIRTFLEARGRSFEPVRTEDVAIPADDVYSDPNPYPEMLGDPFLSCPDRVD